MQSEAQQGQIGRALLAEADAAAKTGDWQLAVAQARAAGEAFARALRLAEGDIVGRYEYERKNRT